MPLVNYSTELINQAGRVGPTMRESLAPMAQGLGGAAAGASTAIQNLVLSRGGDALDAGLKELEAAGLSNPQLEQYFKSIDPTNGDAVTGALDAMAKMVSGGRAQEAARAREAAPLRAEGARRERRAREPRPRWNRART